MICFVFGVEIQVARAQEFEEGANLSKHTIGYVLSYAYPKMAVDSRYVTVKSEFNYGIVAAFEWGKYYTSGISFMITPALYFSDFKNTDIAYYSHSSATGNPNPYLEKTIQLTELEVYVPLSYEFPLLRSIRLGGGAYVSVPLVSTGSVKRVEKGWQEYMYDIDYRFEARVGVSGRLLCQIHRNVSAESYMAFEYGYDITWHEVYAHKTRFGISYIYRHSHYKDVRDKWDRYWIRKQKNKG